MEDRRSCPWIHGGCVRGGGQGGREGEGGKGKKERKKDRRRTGRASPQSQKSVKYEGRMENPPAAAQLASLHTQVPATQSLLPWPGRSAHAGRVSLVCAPRGKGRQGKGGKWWKGGAAWQMHDDTSGGRNIQKEAGGDLHTNEQVKCGRAQPWKSWGTGGRWPAAAAATLVPLSHRYLPVVLHNVAAALDRADALGPRWQRRPAGFVCRCVVVCLGLRVSDRASWVYECGCLIPPNTAHQQKQK